MSKVINKPIIFLPIEHTVRELDYKLNIARFFLKEGFDVILGNPSFIRHELMYKNYQGVFLEKGANPVPEYYRALAEKGIFLYCLSDEGAAHPAYSVTYQPAVDSLKLMRHIFLWGRFQMEDLVQRNPDQQLNKKYKVTGYPGIEFSLPIYKKYHCALKPKNLPKEYILVNTNFGCFNGFSLDEVFKACTAMSPETRKGIIESYKTEEHCFMFFYNILKEIINHFPQETFLIRPHPTEKEEKYINYFSEFKNVVVSKSGSVNQVISSAKLVIHSDCTTALQSYLMDVPVISLAHFYMDCIRANWALSFGALPRTNEEVIKYVSYVLQNRRLPMELEKDIQDKSKGVIESKFNNVVGSTKEIVLIIVSETREKFKNFQPYRLKNDGTLFQKLKFFIYKHLSFIYMLRVPIASRETMIKFSEKDVQQRLDILQDIDGVLFSYNVKKIFYNTYLISKKS